MVTAPGLLPPLRSFVNGVSDREPCASVTSRRIFTVHGTFGALILTMEGERFDHLVQPDKEGT
jgi:hypothetical protein